MVVFNLDFDNKIKPSPYAYEIPSSTQKLHFRIVKNNYPIDYSEFVKLTLVMKEGSYLNKVTTSKVITIGNEKFVEYKLDGSTLSNRKELLIIPTIQLYSGSKTISPIKIVTYDSNESSCRHTEWRLFNNVMDNFNITLGKYYNAIKRDQIDKPNGVVGLDENGKIKFEFLNEESEHPNHKIIETRTKNFPNKDGLDIGIHGFKMDEKWRLTYYDVDDKRYYVVNSIYGGDFGKPNKSSEWNIYGGSWGYQIISAGTFNSLTPIVSSGTFNNQLPNSISANGFNITLNNSIYSGGFVDDLISGGTFANPSINIVNANGVHNQWVYTDSPINGGTW